MFLQSAICEGNDAGSLTASCLFARFAMEVLSVSHGNFSSRPLRSCWLRPPRLWQHPVFSSLEFTKMPYSCSCHKNHNNFFLFIFPRATDFRTLNSILLTSHIREWKKFLRCKTWVNNLLMKPKGNEASEDKNKLGINWLDGAVSKKIFPHCKHNLLGYLSARLRVSHKIQWFTEPRLLSGWKR